MTSMPFCSMIAARPPTSFLRVADQSALAKLEFVFVMIWASTRSGWFSAYRSVSAAPSDCPIKMICSAPSSARIS